MSTIINYFFEANVALILFFIVYALFLRNETQFSFSRYFLLGSLVSSLLLPLFHFSGAFTESIPSVGDNLPVHWLPEMGINPLAKLTTPITDSFPIWPAVEWFYLTVAAVMTVVFLSRIALIIWLAYNSTKYEWKSCRVAETDSKNHTFSFFHFIFLGQAIKLTAEEKAKVLEHELVHVQQIHSADIMLTNLIQIIFWYNPIVLYYKKALVQLHEFEADARSVEESEVDSYCSLMARAALESAGFSLVNHFHNSLTLKRITMMKTIKKKIQVWKIGALAVAIPVIFFVVSCQDQLADVNKVKEVSGSSIIYPAEVKEQLAVLQKEAPGAAFVVMEMNEDGRITLDKLKKENARFFSDMHIIKTDASSEGHGQTYVILKHDKTQNIGEIIVEGHNIAGDVHDFAETQPQYMGGQDSLRAYIGRSVRYPESERTAGSFGKVFVRFIVEKDGSITNAEIIKGVSPLLDKTALDVVQNMPKWIPGKQSGEPVRVKFVVPINFAI